MALQITLPKLGLTMEEGTILEWVVAAGDQVSVGDVIMRMATDKVDVDVEAEGAGRFEPVAQAGATLPPGALVAWLLESGEAVPAAAPATGPADGGVAVEGAAGSTPSAPVDGSAARQPVSPNARRLAKEHGLDVAVLTGTGPGGRVVSEDVEDALAAAAAVPVLPAQATRPPVLPPVRAAGATSPLVRKQAAARGIDVSALQGSGLGGRVRRADIDAAAAQPVAAPAPVGPRAGDVVPLTGMRGAIARSMHASLQEMAQLTHGYEAEVGEVVALRTRLKAEWAGTGLPVPSLNDFVVRAAALALVEHPGLNATVREDGIHLLEQVNVGVAVAVPGGLLVPVVPDADRCTLVAIAEQTRALATAARSGGLSMAQLEGGTFVVTSLGSYGVDFFTPVVNPGNVAILGVGRVRDGVRWEGEVPTRTTVLTLSLSFDHRAVDGAPAAEFLRTVAGLLARPLLLLAG